MAETGIEQPYRVVRGEHSHYPPINQVTPRSLPAIETPNIANTSRTRSIPSASDRRYGTISTDQQDPPKPCHVCGRPCCPLVSHRLYVYPTTRRARSSAAVSQSPSRRVQPPIQDALQLREILEIRTGKIDAFMNLPIREQSRDNDLFQHCKSPSFTPVSRHANQVQ